MADQFITCPNCHHQFSLSEELKKEFEAENNATIDALKRQQQQSLEKKEAEFARKLEQSLSENKAKIAEDAHKKAQQQFALELENLKKTSDEQQQRIKEAQQRELELMHKQRQLDEERQSLELDIQRRLEQEREALQAKAKEQALSQFEIKLAEKDKQLDQTKRALEDAQRKATQGSMQIQGDAQEMVLRDGLREAFPYDVINDVPTGMRGADLLHEVHNQLNIPVGTIIWESKNTKNWLGDWIQKLKNDQSSANADIAILISKVIPEDINGVGTQNGVWVTTPENAISLVQTLRYHLIELHAMRGALKGQDDKMELLYEYLTGAQFKNRIENMVNAFQSLKTQLDKERTSMERIWSKREKELLLLSKHTSGFYGDMQGLIGHQVLQVTALELDPDDEDSLLNSD